MIQQKPVQDQARGERKPVFLTNYQGDNFSLGLLEGWQDKTLYTLSGPVTDDIQHCIVIVVAQGLPFTSVREFAEQHISTAEQELKSCQLLKKGNITLANGMPAYQAIFSWYPTESLKVYQEQLFVLSGVTAYTLTATFSKKSRKTLGPQVERMMLSFEPAKAKSKTEGVQR